MMTTYAFVERTAQPRSAKQQAYDEWIVRSQTSKRNYGARRVAAGKKAARNKD